MNNVKHNSVKNKLNIVGRGYIKNNNTGGEIIAFVPDLPVSISGYLDDFLFIFTIPAQDQKYAPVYCRLQNKFAPTVEDEVKEFTEVKSMGYVGKNNSDIIICAPKTHVWVELNKTVVIATVPNMDKSNAPVYFKKKTYNIVPRKERQDLDDVDFECYDAVVEDVGEYPEELV